VIVSTLSVTKPREIKNFQIALPCDAGRIIGVEWGAIRSFYAVTGNYTDPELWGFPNMNDPLFQVKPNKVIGEISMQTLGPENVFFRGEIKDKDSNIFWADFSNPVINQFKEWTHRRRMEEMEINVDNNTIVEVCYKDRLGIINAVFALYTVHLYLWVEKNG
jgi:hypothetical protein